MVNEEDLRKRNYKQTAQVLSDPVAMDAKMKSQVPKWLKDKHHPEHGDFIQQNIRSVQVKSPNSKSKSPVTIKINRYSDDTSYPKNPAFKNTTNTFKSTAATNKSGKK